jgi:hypothetical protein
MIQKRLIRPERLRQVPPSFNWADHRLVRDHYIERCDCTSLALYLFLVVVSDAQGLSYYSEASLCRRLIIEERLIVPSRTTRTLRDNSLSVRHFRSISKEPKGTQKDPFFGIQYQMAVSNGALNPLRILFMVEPLIAESPP